MTLIKHRKNAIKQNKSDIVWNIGVYAILIIFSIMTLYPFLNVIAVSLSSADEVAKGAVSFFPKDLTLDAYKSVLKGDVILVGYKNTIYVTLLTTVFGVLCTAMMAYPLSRERLPGKKFFLIFVSITMWFHAGMIPRFLVMKQLNLLDSLNGIVLANLVTGYNVTVMRNFFSEIPKSLEESAELDGCNEIQILYKIVLPLSLPIMATVGLWIMVACWNSFFEPLLFLTSDTKYTLQIFLRDIVVNSSAAANDMETGTVTSTTVKYATIVVAFLPVLAIYPFIQKYFVKGTMTGAVKG